MKKVPTRAPAPERVMLFPLPKSCNADVVENESHVYRAWLILRRWISKYVVPLCEKCYSDETRPPSCSLLLSLSDRLLFPHPLMSVAAFAVFQAGQAAAVALARGRRNPRTRPGRTGRRFRGGTTFWWWVHRWLFFFLFFLLLHPVSSLSISFGGCFLVRERKG